ncbi:MAG: ABC transporter permease [Butyricicoccus sp.]|nr:ABC transporter permease [Butyricicoccus pullicaecorum]MDY5972532.1 ABC transporter permease [Butyricicoccus sp.]
MAYPYGVWMVIFIICPILLIVLYAFSDGAGGATLANFAGIVEYWPIFVRSFFLAFVSTVICLALGYPLAYIMSRQPPHRQQLYMTLIMLPMWMNFLLRTYAWMSILENKGFINQFLNRIGFIGFLQSAFGYTLDYIPLINTSGAVVLGMVYNFLPFMVLPIYTVLIKLDPKLIEAAQDLGAPAGIVFRRVIFPLSLPGVISGITMVFVPSVSTFVISKLLGGGKYMLVGDLIDLQFMGNAYNPALGSAIALVMMVLIFLCMWIMNKFDDGSSEEGGLML